MSLRAVLAGNLARLCGQTGKSINQICREMGVNRQQFETYLTQERLPNQATTDKICNYFNVEELDLYRIGSERSVRDVHRGDRACASLVKQLSAPQPAPIDGGFYLTYFAVPGRTDVAVRSITVIRREEGRTTFRRLTGLFERPDSAWRYAQGDHQGIVSLRSNWYYFAGINRRAINEPSLLVMQWAPLSAPALVGKALVMTEVGPSATGVVMHRAPKTTTLREVLRTARTFALDDPTIDPVAARLLRASVDPASP